MSEKTIKCPSCSGDILANKKEKSFLEMGKGVVESAVLMLKSLVSTPTKSETISRKSIYEGSCPDCGGKGTFPDTSDTSKQQKNAVKVAEKNSDAILAAEAKLDTGGYTNSRHVSVLGNQVVEIGVGFNKLKSYSVVEGGKPVKAKTNIGKRGTTGGTATTNQINGTNPLSTPGGQYYIKCSNKFTLLAGAQGIELNTLGNLNIVGGITKITGAEMNIGSSIGTTTIEGNHLKLTGKTIELTPANGSSTGQVQVNATLGVDGNMVVSGGAHIDGELHFISATTTKLDPKPTSLGALPFKTTGKAQWGSTTGDAQKASMQDLQNNIQTFTNDPGGFLQTPRGVNAFTERMEHIAYTNIPMETSQTGWAIGVDSSGDTHMLQVYNFPHNHTMPDNAHQHTVDMPNIKLLDDDTQVRDQAADCQKPQPVPTVNGGQSVTSNFAKSMMS